MSDINNVVASGVVLSDHESSGNSSSKLRNIHHNHPETNASHDFMATATPPVTILGTGEVQ
jgi:hypothetical protein